MPCLELNKKGKGVQKKCKYQKLRCYNGVNLAHLFTFLVCSFQEKLTLTYTTPGISWQQFLGIFFETPEKV